jgi:predicted metalloprotease
MVVGGGLGGLILVVLFLVLGGNPLALLQSGPAAGPALPAPTSAAEEQQAEFIATVLADTEDVWNRLLAERGLDYREPTLVLFRGEVGSACGYASSASGPFYCPADAKVYLDLSFFDELERRFGAPGDFAEAYVIAHEVGHHVQRLLGIMDGVDRRRSGLGEEQWNALSVRLELQADFFAGVWAHHAQQMKQILEPGDIDEALRAASAIGDDTLQRRARGYVVPESFTHGTSAQRVAWFRLGFETGDIGRGDTFNEPDP